MLVAKALHRFGKVDVLVNSTGIFRVVPFLEQTEAQFEEALNSILRPTFYTSQSVAKAMVESGKGGAIVNVGSMWAIDAIAVTPTSAYSAAQAGRHALTKNLAIELAEHGIRVNTVALAFVETPAYERFMTPEQARDVLDSVHPFHPLGRHGVPADVVEAILFYASATGGLDHRHHDADRRRHPGRSQCPAPDGRRLENRPRPGAIPAVAPGHATSSRTSLRSLGEPASAALSPARSAARSVSGPRAMRPLER